MQWMIPSALRQLALHAQTGCPMEMLVPWHGKAREHLCHEIYYQERGTLLVVEFFATKLKAATSDPETKMEFIKAKLKLDYAYEIDQENYIKHILDSLPAWFDATIEFMHKDLNSYEFLDLEEVNEQIRVRHSSLQSKGD